MDIIEMIDERQAKQLDELGKLKATDPNFKYICDNIKILGDTKVNERKEENARLNNNDVNDINRMKVEVEHEKVLVEKMRVKTDQMRVVTGVFSDIMDKAAAAGFCWIAYNSDKVSYAVKSIFDTARGYLRQRRH